jgi:hypothetical protein
MAIAVTGTVIVQLPDAGIVPPERATELPPLVMVTVPPQVFVEGEPAVFFILADGYVSVKAAPVIATALGLVSVMVMFEAPFIGIVSGVKPLVTVGGAIAVRVAEAAAMVIGPSAEIVPVLFKYAPATIDVTGTTMEQLLEAGIVALERANELPPLVIVTVPPQVLDEGAAAVFFMLVDG